MLKGKRRGRGREKGRRERGREEEGGEMCWSQLTVQAVFYSFSLSLCLSLRDWRREGEWEHVEGGGVLNYDKFDLTLDSFTSSA